MIVVYGSVSLDLIANVPRLPGPGETVMGGAFAMAPGGKGANQALAARRAGAEVRAVCAVGTDEFALPATALLAESGIDLTCMRRVEGRTGIASIYVDAAGENAIAVLPGANASHTAAGADAALADLGRGDTLMVQQEIPQGATERALQLARIHGATAILNTAPFLKTTPLAAREAAIVVANETEFALLCGGRGGPLETLMAEWARERGQTVIVTLGAAGARAATAEGAAISVPAMAVKPVDTVGAGDTFCGYLAAGLDAGMTLEDAMRRAAVAASLACLKPGAQPSIPYGREVDAAVSSGSR